MPTLDRLPPSLDRRVQFDRRSRAFPITEVLTAEEPRSWTWRCEVNLDQGKEGACVGFGWAHERASQPVPDLAVANSDAFALYKRAQHLDRWPGEAYDGTSVLAGAKAAKELQWLKEYRWAFNLNDALTALSWHGPIVLGVAWYEGMWSTDEKGLIHVTGKRSGGHCILARGVNVPNQTVLLHNSWGPNWGGTQWGPGTALISWDDLGRLLGEQGEACVPVVR